MIGLSCIIHDLLNPNHPCGGKTTKENELTP